MGLTRRDFLMKVGQAGGYSAAFTMMQSLGLLPVMASAAPTVKHPEAPARGPAWSFWAAALPGWCQRMSWAS